MPAWSAVVSSEPLIKRLRNEAVSNRLILSMARGNYRRARREGKLGLRWLGLIAWQSAKIVVLPWNWLPVGGVA